jgi:hypothetical protein
LKLLRIDNFGAINFRVVFGSMTCLLRAEDVRALQDDLDSLQVWEKEWQTEFNAAKCDHPNYHQEEPRYLPIPNTPDNPQRK